MVEHEHLERDTRPSGAVAVLGVAACGLVAVPLVVLVATAAGLGGVWAVVLGLCTPSLLLVLWGLALAAAPGSAERAVVVPRRQQGADVEPPEQVASAA